MSLAIYKFISIFVSRAIFSSTIYKYKIAKMQDKEQIIGYLEETLSGVIAGAQQHFMHATINKHNGFNKIGDRMMQESTEEMNGAGKFIKRIIELGGVPDVQPEKWPVLMNIEEQLKVEFREQEMALSALNGIIKAIENDDVSRQLFQEYLMEETNHTHWLKQQLDLIASIGLQNYLASQI